MWKTIDSGRVWTPVFDGQPVASEVVGGDGIERRQRCARPSSRGRPEYVEASHHALLMPARGGSVKRCNRAWNEPLGTDVCRAGSRGVPWRGPLGPRPVMP